jgi:hypothetical protein
MDELNRYPFDGRHEELQALSTAEWCHANTTPASGMINVVRLD